MRRWFMLLMFITPMAFSQSMTTKVIELHDMQASQLISNLKPLLQPGESVTENGNSLIVNASQETLTRIQSIIQQLDKPPVTFEISIHQGPADWLDHQNNQTRTYGTTSANIAPQNQSVQVNNGEAAMISTGGTRPVLSSVTAGIFPGVGYKQQTLQQGFLVKPVLQGEQVTIQIQRMRDQASLTDPNQTNDQQMETTVTIPLDQWVKLGSSAQSQSDDTDDSVTYRAGNTYSVNSTLFIRVGVVSR